MKYSEQIAGFLRFLREAQQEYSIATAEEQEANNATQDILHRIELNENKYHEYARLSIALRDIRRQRRAAKDKQLKLQPVIDLLEQEQKLVKTLERLLGDVRKAEKSAEGRAYCPRTDAVERALEGGKK